jgi:hypothetical protein
VRSKRSSGVKFSGIPIADQIEYQVCVTDVGFTLKGDRKGFPSFVAIAIHFIYTIKEQIALRVEECVSLHVYLLALSLAFKVE